VALLQEWLANTRKLSASPSWVRSLSKAGYRVAWGNYERARELFEDALEKARKAGALEDPESRDTLSISFYNLACVYSLASAGKRYTRAKPSPVLEGEAKILRAKALDALERSLDLGYREFGHIRGDSDLSPIHATTEFVALLAKYEKK